MEVLINNNIKIAVITIVIIYNMFAQIDSLYDYSPDWIISRKLLNSNGFNAQIHQIFAIGLITILLLQKDSLINYTYWLLILLYGISMMLSLF